MREQLEPRRLFAGQISITFTPEMLSIAGTEGNDDILVTYNSFDRFLRVYDHGVLREMGVSDTLHGIGVDCSNTSSVMRYDTDRITIDPSVPARISANIYTGFGNDTLIGGNGNDWLHGQGGVDQMFGGDGDDSLGGDGGVYHGGNGDDTLIRGTSAELFGDAGQDFLSYKGADVPIFVNLGDELANDGPAGTHNLAHDDIEVILGGAKDDYLVGNANKDWLQGDDGNDTLRGYGGKDRLLGGDGIDKLYGGDANDILDGGSSNDRLQGDAGDDVMYGKKGDDHFYAKGDGGVDRLIGADGNDDARVDPTDLLDHIEIVG
jgi:Ca2+-binding RTX toxin-like protein